MDYLHHRDKRAHPRTRANCISKVFFLYTLGLFWNTYRRRKSDAEGVFEVLSEQSSETLGNQLESTLKNELDRYGSLSVYRILLASFGREYILIGLLQLFMRTIVVVMIPWNISQIISYFQPNQTELTKTDVYIYAVFLIILNLLNITYLHNYLLYLTSLGIKIRTSFCALIYRKCLKLSASALSSISPGNIVTLMTKDVTAFETIVMYANDVWIGFLQTAVIFYLLYRRVGLAALVGVAVFLSVIPVQIYVGKVVSKLRIKSSRNTDNRIQATHETLSYIKVLKMYTWEDIFEERITRTRRIEVNTLVKVFIRKIVILLLGALTSKIAFSSMVITYVALGNQVSAELAYFIIALFQRVRHAFNVVIPMGITESAELYASTKRIEALLKAETVAKESDNKTSQDDSPSLLMKNVFVDVKDQVVLRDVSLDIGPGLTIVSGPVGSGKSILLKVLLKDMTIKQGTLDIIGTISYASQEPWIFPSTFKQNILLGEKYDQYRYEQVLRVCALQVDRDRFPGGDDFLINMTGLNISSGQKARLNLARAIYRDADIYLFDDCLRSLDIHVQDYIFKECVQRFLNGKICIFVTHNRTVFDKCTTLLWVENGSVEVKKFNDVDYSMKDANAQLPLVQLNGDMKLGDCDEVSANETTELLKSKHTSSGFEGKRTGTVNREVYKRYIRLGGGYFLCILTVICFTVTQACKSYSEKMVSNWVNLEENISLYRSANGTATEEFETALEAYRFTLLLYGSLVLATVTLATISATLLFNFTRSASNRLHHLMVKSVVGAVMHFHDITPLGSIINRFSKDLAVIDEQLPFIVYDFIEILLSFCGVVILLAYINLLFLIPVTVIVLMMYLMRKLYMPTGTYLQRIDVASRSPMVGYLNASLEGLTTIRALNVEPLLIKEFDKHQDLYTSANYTSRCCARAFGYFLDLCCSVFIATVVARFVIFNHDITVGDVGLALTQAYTLTGFVQYGIRQWAEMENKMTSVERSVEYTKVQEEKAGGDKVPVEWPTKGKIEFKEVNLDYYRGNGRTLKDITFTVEPGEKVGVVGRTGAGKSTLISTLFRLYFFEGKITVDGIDIKRVQLNTLRRKLTIIPQDPVLFSGTIRHNLDPRGCYTDTELWVVVDKVALKGLITSLDAPITDINLSTGQKQLVSIARAVLRKNKIVIFDELTANVDNETERIINEVVKENFTTCTVLVIAHKLETVIGLDKVMVLDNGSIVEYDGPARLLDNKDGNFHSMVRSSGLLK